MRFHNLTSSADGWHDTLTSMRLHEAFIRHFLNIFPLITWRENFIHLKDRKKYVIQTVMLNWGNGKQGRAGVGLTYKSLWWWQKNILNLNETNFHE